jgi:AcrR family transcriptional regulator
VRVFGRRGLSAVTMDEIAAECGVATSAVYYHFSSKDELFHAAFDAVRDDILMITGGDESPTATLREVVIGVFRWAQEHPERANLLWVYSAGATPAMAQAWESFIDGHVENLFRYASDAVARPIQVDELSRRAARAGIVAGNAIALDWVSGRRFAGVDADRLAESVASMLERMFTLLRQSGAT